MGTAAGLGGAPTETSQVNATAPAASHSVKAAPSADVTASPDSKTGIGACAKAGDTEAGAPGILAHKAKGDLGAKQIGLAHEHKARQGCFSCGRQEAAGTDKPQHSGCTIC